MMQLANFPHLICYIGRRYLITQYIGQSGCFTPAWMRHLQYKGNRMKFTHRHIIYCGIFLLWTTGDTCHLPAETSTSPAGKIPTIRWQEANDYIDQKVYAIGRVVLAAKSPTGHVFLNFDRDYRNTLTIFIRNTDCENFATPPHKLYAQKYIRVHGKLYEYNSCPNINVSDPKQIRILPGPPEESMTGPKGQGNQPTSSITRYPQANTSNTDIPATAPAPSSQPATTQPTLIQQQKTITIASYNVKNLFDAYDDPYYLDSEKDAKPSAEQDALAFCIRQLDADVLALMEVENRGCLQYFVDHHLADLGYKHVVHLEGNSRRGIDVALLSRLTVGPVTSHRHLRSPDGEHNFLRDLLQVRIEPADGDSFDVFVVHYISKGGEQHRGDNFRQAEAKLTRQVLNNILEGHPQADFVICGDFNDTIDSPTLNIVHGRGPSALSCFVEQENLRGTPTYNRPPYRFMIDFILASPGMADRYVSGSYRIPTGKKFLIASDHNPIVAEFKMK